MKIKLFSDKVFYKKLSSVAFPIALQNLMLAAVAAADALMLGRVEQNAMSAVFMATQFQFVQNLVLSSITGVCGILGAQYWGKKDEKSLNDVFSITFKMAGTLSLVSFLLCMLVPRGIMRLLTNVPELIDIGADYLRVAGWSYLLTGFSQTYLAMMKVTEKASLAARISSGGVIINIALNAVLIFGLLGIPALGVKGAALATLIARVVELLWAVILSSRKKIPGMAISGLRHHNKLLLKDYCRCLWPVVGAGLFWGVGFTAYTAFIGHLGADAAAANSVASVIRDLVCCLCAGLGYGGGIIVGNALGAGDLDMGKEYGERLLKLSFLCGVVSMLVMLALSPLIMRFVRLSGDARTLLAGMMAVMSVYMIGRSVTTVTINGVFGAGGDTLFDLYSLAVCMWGIALPLAALGTFVFHWHPVVVYACTCLDEIGKLPWVVAHFKKYKWVKNLTRDNMD